MAGAYDDVLGLEDLVARPHVMSIDNLEPYPRCSFDQGIVNSFYYSEEPLGRLPHRRSVAISDRATLTSLLVGSDGYTLSTGVLAPEMHAGVTSVPLDADETMLAGYLTHRERVASDLLGRCIERLRDIISKSPGVRVCP